MDSNPILGEVTGKVYTHQAIPAAPVPGPVRAGSSGSSGEEEEEEEGIKEQVENQGYAVSSKKDWGWVQMGPTIQEEGEGNDLQQSEVSDELPQPQSDEVPQSQQTNKLNKAKKLPTVGSLMTKVTGALASTRAKLSGRRPMQEGMPSNSQHERVIPDQKDNNSSTARSFRVGNRLDGAAEVLASMASSSNADVVKPSHTDVKADKISFAGNDKGSFTGIVSMRRKQGNRLVLSLDDSSRNMSELKGEGVHALDGSASFLSFEYSNFTTNNNSPIPSSNRQVICITPKNNKAILSRAQQMRLSDDT